MSLAGQAERREEALEDLLVDASSSIDHLRDEVAGFKLSLPSLLMKPSKLQRKRNAFSRLEELKLG